MTTRPRFTKAVAIRSTWAANWQVAIQFLLLLAVACAVACSGSGAESPTSPQILDPVTVANQNFQFINQARSSEGIGPVSLDGELSRIARKHSEAMRDRGFFAHQDPNGNGLRSRLKSAGVSFSAAGENLALVTDTANPAGLAHQQLLASPEHREVMLAKRFVRAGVGVAQSGSSYWITQIYLKP